MRKIAAVESISLDGVMQAPGRPDEDERGGFAHGGWGVPYAADPVQGRRDRRAHAGRVRPAVRPPHLRGLPPLLGRAHRQPVLATAGRGPQVRRLDHADRSADLGELRAAPRRRRGQGAARRAAASRSWAAASCCGRCWPRTSSTSCCCSCTRSCSAPVSGCSPSTVRMPGCGWWTPRRPARAS